MRRSVGSTLTAAALVAALPGALWAHGGHAHAGDGFLHAVMHGLPVATVLLVALLGLRSTAMALAARQRQ